MQTPLHHPHFDPVLVHLWGPIQLRWYSILYVGGFFVGRFILIRLAREKRFRFTAKHVEQLISWLLGGAILGARIAYCLVYDPTTFFEDPISFFAVYRGGLSFHGALAGIIVVTILFSRYNKIPFWNLADAMALATPTGLAMGRLGNFINGELYGRVTDVPWGMVFATGGPFPRHPSQLYELFLEGVVLFSVLWFLKTRLKKDGQIAIAFLIGYSLIRFVVEFFREPDTQVGYLVGGVTMGQLLSALMWLLSIATALWLSTKAWKK